MVCPILSPFPQRSIYAIGSRAAARVRLLAAVSPPNAVRAHAPLWGRPSSGWPRWRRDLGMERTSTQLIADTAAARGCCCEYMLVLLRGDEPFVWLPERRRLPRA
jgi:hypothetical protein